MSPSLTATMRFEADPARAGAARRFVVSMLREWGLDRFEEDAALCTAELAANAVLHSRTPFTVALRPAGPGVRVDLQDDRPDRIPELAPPEIAPLEVGTTGRGLKLIAGLAARWGYFTTEMAKTVWVELGEDRPPEPVAPVVQLTRHAPHSGGRLVRLIGLPVRAAVASGVQIDDLVRDLQLQPDRLTPQAQRLFLELLERSAPARLAGRHAGFRAAANGLDRFDMELNVTPEEVSAVSELGLFLDDLARRAVLDAGRVDPDVAAMRAWLNQEVPRQMAGGRPISYRG